MINQQLPADLPKHHWHYSDLNPIDNTLLALADVLALVENGAKTLGVNAHKPGVPDFGKAIYSDNGILEQISPLPLPVKRKIDYLHKHNLPIGEIENYLKHYRAFMVRMEKTHFSGILLDYDGTMVAGPYEKVSAVIQSVLLSLLEHGIQLGFASGRGKSLTQALQSWIPKIYWPQIYVGYYNGGIILTLNESLKIAKEKLPHNPNIVQARERLLSTQHIVSQCQQDIKENPAQTTLIFRQDANINELINTIKDVFSTSKIQHIKTVQSDHSIDILPTSSSKNLVLEKMQSIRDPKMSGEVLCIGDRGQETGNDYELLGNPFALSVNQVCGRVDAGWNLLSAGLHGPEGLASYLLRISPSADGTFHIKP